MTPLERLQVRGCECRRVHTEEEKKEVLVVAVIDHHGSKSLPAQPEVNMLVVSHFYYLFVAHPNKISGLFEK